AELELPDDAVVKGLAEFNGVGRRFQRYGELPAGDGTFTLIDDYGHHPAEMAATLAAARGADAVLLADVYAAGEPPIVAADGRALARALRVAGSVDPVFVDEIGAMAE